MIVFYDGFWLAPGEVKLEMTTSGPNPLFYVQNMGLQVLGPEAAALPASGRSPLNKNVLKPEP